MSKSYKLSLAAIAASLSLVGCGSDSDSTPTTPTTSNSTPTTHETVTGQFVDTYVAGLNYTCSSGTTGITNNMGEYTCNVGDTVEFSIGSYVLGSVTASSGIITPEALYPGNSEAALNVAQVIQSLDVDPTDDIITIPENFTALDNVTTTPTDVDFDALIEGVLDVPLVTEEEAQNHLDETELMLSLGGKTFLIGSDELIVFNDDLTFVNFTATDGTVQGTSALSIDGEKLTLVDYNEYIVLQDEVSSDYLLFKRFDLAGTLVGEEEFYAWGKIEITQSDLDGKTFYEYDYDEGYNEALYAKMTFDAGVLTRIEVIDGGAPESFTVNYDIIGGKVRIDVPAMEGDPTEYIWWTLMSQSADSWTMFNEDDQNKDGTIEESYTFTMDLSKPTNFPESL